jgi:hypothetical protein
MQINQRASNHPTPIRNMERLPEIDEQGVDKQISPAVELDRAENEDPSDQRDDAETSRPVRWPTRSEEGLARQRNR